MPVHLVLKKLFFCLAVLGSIPGTVTSPNTNNKTATPLLELTGCNAGSSHSDVIYQTALSHIPEELSPQIIGFLWIMN